MNARQIRSWLLRMPRAAQLRVRTEDDTTHEIECAGQSWAALGQSIAALNPVLIEKLDAKGKLTGAVRPDEWDEGADEDDAPPAAAPTSSSAATTASDAMVFADAHTRLMSEFARHLSEAYRHSTEVAFARMVDLFSAVNKRGEATERSLDALYKLLRRVLDDQVENAVANAAEKNTDPLSELVGAVLTGFAASGAPTPHPPTNGAASATNGAAGATNGKA